MPLVAGREFTASDVAAGGEVAVVNQAFLSRFNLGPDAIGKRMELGGYGAAPWRSSASSATRSMAP